ncbi:MAG: phage holin family protein [Burkholderia sp.]|jgi:dipeptide/tripeptide permease|nr:phage holin family protein [Burkholderia sp.]
MMIDKTDKSLGSLLSDLTRDTVDLVRQEIALARAEMATKITGAQVALTSVAVGAAVLLAGLFIILQAIVNGVAMVLPEEVAPWLAPLLVGLVVAAVGYGMLKGGSAKLTADNLMPQKTMDSLRRDKMVIEEKMQ